MYSVYENLQATQTIVQVYSNILWYQTANIIQAQIKHCLAIITIVNRGKQMARAL